MNQVHCLYLISKKIQIPDIYNWKLEKQRLMNSGYLSLEGKITPEGKKVVKKFSSLFETIKSKTATELLGSNYKENIEAYRKLFPTKAGDRRGIRSSDSQLVPKFEWFFKNHSDISWEEVLKATALYVETTENRYIQNAMYFIKKMDPDKTWVSNLAAWVEDYREDKDSPQENRFSGSSTLL